MLSSKERGHTVSMSRLWYRVPTGFRHLVAQLPQSRLAATTARRLTPSRLRILAFHGIADLRQFELVLDAILGCYEPVSEDQIVEHLQSGKPLPRYPVWFTFDDGLPSTLAASSFLAKRGVRATAFVCPSVLDTTERLWFQTWDDAAARGILADSTFTLSHLKSTSDAERRSITTLLEERLSDAGAVGFPQATQGQLEDWVRAGHYIGNHTWDHPLLDRCSPADQHRQVLEAHKELVERGFAPRFLAYPNGNTGPGAIRAARELRYTGSLRFDHRLASPRQDPHLLSRLRIDSDVPVKRAVSILSGAHSAMVHLAM